MRAVHSQSPEGHCVFVRGCFSAELPCGINLNRGQGLECFFSDPACSLHPSPPGMHPSFPSEFVSSKPQHRAEGFQIQAGEFDEFDPLRREVVFDPQRLLHGIIEAETGELRIAVPS